MVTDFGFEEPRVEPRSLAGVHRNDLWIAAVAVSRGLPVVTQDDNFAALDGATGFSQIRV